MNGVHDMGGMHGMGPIRHESRRADVPRSAGKDACTRLRACCGTRSGLWNIDAFRHRARGICRPPSTCGCPTTSDGSPDADEPCVAAGDVTQRGDREREAGRRRRTKGRAGRSRRRSPRCRPARSARRDVRDPRRRFKSGQRVRARNIIRRVTRACRVTCAASAEWSCAIAACFVFPDTNAHLRRRETAARLLRAIRRARALGRTSDRRAISMYLDMWDDYLEPA